MSWIEITGLVLAFFAGTGFGIGLLGLCQANRFEAERYGGYIDLTGTRSDELAAANAAMRDALRPTTDDLVRAGRGYIEPGRKR